MSNITGMKCFKFDYKDFNEYEKNLSELEAKAIITQFEIMAQGNDSFLDKSSPELDEAYWLFKHGWICRSLLQKLIK